MYVCLCNGITDTQIRNAIQEGASSFKDVRSTLGVGSQCGKCGILTREILRDTLRDDGSDQELFYAIS
jgi:bacterioferritin-associated ferredoxin